VGNCQYGYIKKIEKIRKEFPGRNVIKFVDNGCCVEEEEHWLLRGGTTAAPHGYCD
jgi:hypothetical protein